MSRPVHLACGRYHSLFLSPSLLSLTHSAFFMFGSNFFAPLSFSFGPRSSLFREMITSSEGRLLAFSAWHMARAIIVMETSNLVDRKIHKKASGKFSHSQRKTVPRLIGHRWHDFMRQDVWERVKMHKTR